MAHTRHEALDGLPPLPTGGRAAGLQELLPEVGCEALLVTDLVNIRWLTGFTGSAGRLVVLPDRLVLVTDGRYAEQAAAQLEAAGVEAEVAEGRSQTAQQRALEGLVQGVATLGLEARHVTWAEQRAAAEWFGGQLVPTDHLVERLRRTKDDGEVARIEAAAAICDRALELVVGRLADEPTEADVRDELEGLFRALGADGPSFETIVASGPEAALPHHRPSRRRIVEGDFVIIDAGALVDGYHSDMTRTFVVGAPSPEQLEWLVLVTEAQAAGVAAVGPGVAASEVDLACRRVIDSAGRGEEFTHGTGHGVGLLIHEAPWLNATSADVLQVGDVVTVEPGVYRSPSGGVRVEDALLVTATGCRPLTKAPKDHACPPSPRTN
jgi:Xaa-Pro aminopeptidase